MQKKTLRERGVPKVLQKNMPAKVLQKTMTLKVLQKKKSGNTQKTGRRKEEHADSPGRRKGARAEGGGSNYFVEKVHVCKICHGKDQNGKVDKEGLNLSFR